MTPFLFFIGSLLLLCIEGWCVAHLLIPKNDYLLTATLTLPLAALSNVLLLFVFTVFNIPLLTSWLAIGHILIILALIVAGRFVTQPSSMPDIPGDLMFDKWWKITLIALCVFILTAVFVYAIAHALLLPTFQYDSLTNWMMRSKMSFIGHRIIFDNDGAHVAIRKPYYPFLLHALHLMGNMGQSNWNDQLATSLPFLVSMSLLASTFLLLRRVTGNLLALLAITITIGVPLFAIHLGEGYADHLLAEFGMAALAAFALSHKHSSPWLLTLSALLASAAVWTKAEGIFFVFIPWLLLALAFAWPMRQLRWKEFILPFAITAITALPWPFFLLIHEYGFTPHGSSDTHLAYQAGSISAIASVLTFGGSFGIFWPLLLAAIIMVLIAWKRGHISTESLLFFLPGILCFLEVIAIYTVTPNVEYLLNGESFDRQLLAPAALLVAALTLGISQYFTPKERRSGIATVNQE